MVLKLPALTLISFLSTVNGFLVTRFILPPGSTLAKAALAGPFITRNPFYVSGNRLQKIILARTHAVNDLVPSSFWLITPRMAYWL